METRGQLLGATSLLPPCGFWGPNPGDEPWRQPPLPDDHSVLPPSLLLSFETRSCCVPQVLLKLSSLLPQPPACWNYRLRPPYLAVSRGLLTCLSPYSQEIGAGFHCVQELSLRWSWSPGSPQSLLVGLWKQEASRQLWKVLHPSHAGRGCPSLSQ